MVNFTNISQDTFLKEYWQKKPLHIKNALPNFEPFIDEHELSGLSLEEDIESRLVFETPHETQKWHLKKGPFSEKTFATLPKSHWTLLVQGVDRVIPEVSILLDEFNFLPQWRVDDVMISVAGLKGSVGPHYDNYDVFLYQAKGRRQWSLTKKDCNEKNVIAGLPLRIMEKFSIERHIILEEGDMLYLPPHVGHHGVSLSDNSIGYSFGYRSYRAQELMDSFTDYLAEHKKGDALYLDPDWSNVIGSGEIPKEAFQAAKEIMLALLHDDNAMQAWFSQFATGLDESLTAHLTEPLAEVDAGSLSNFLQDLSSRDYFYRESCSRIAYHFNEHKELTLFINGDGVICAGVTIDLIKMIAAKRKLPIQDILPFMTKKENQWFVFHLWQQQFLVY